MDSVGKSGELCSSSGATFGQFFRIRNLKFGVCLIISESSGSVCDKQDNAWLQGSLDDKDDLAGFMPNCSWGNQAQKLFPPRFPLAF